MAERKMRRKSLAALEEQASTHTDNMALAPRSLTMLSLLAGRARMLRRQHLH
jgi:hypothetical protein